MIRIKFTNKYPYLSTKFSQIWFNRKVKYHDPTKTRQISRQSVNSNKLLKSVKSVDFKAMMGLGGRTLVSKYNIGFRKQYLGEKAMKMEGEGNKTISLQHIQNKITQLFQKQSLADHTVQSITQKLTKFKEIQQLTQLSINHSTNIFMHSNTVVVQLHLQPSKIKQYQTATQLNQYFKQHNQIPNNVRILHALAHIQFNAFLAYIDTYCTLYLQNQHSQTKKLFLKHIASIAQDQCRHCIQLIKRLQDLGYNYGDIPVLTTLSNTINKTQGDLIARTIMISIIHEGKGMAAIKKLKSKVRNSDNKDNISVGILEEIERQEVFHYQTGIKFLHYLISAQNQMLEEEQFSLRLKEQIQRIRYKYGYKLNEQKTAQYIVKDYLRLTIG